MFVYRVEKSHAPLACAYIGLSVDNGIPSSRYVVNPPYFYLQHDLSNDNTFFNIWSNDFELTNSSDSFSPWL